MSCEAALEAFTAVRDCGSSDSGACVEGSRRCGVPVSARRPETLLGRADSESDCGFLSEREAAEYLGMSTAELVGLRNFDLAMIKEGFKPHGPPPLWRGRLCIYATENLDEWILGQMAIRGARRLRGHPDVPLAEIT